MHPGRYRFVLAALVSLLVAIAMPAAAVAQSAGEDQYTDPLAGSGSGGGGSSGGSGNSGSGNAPARPAASQSQADPTPTPQARSAQANSNTLPRTGFPVALLIGSGLVLTGTGLALRRTA
jgi:hypothetical protein